MLGAGLAQHRQALARADDQRPQVDAELHVEVLGLDLVHRRADPDAGVVDQHVEAPVGLAVLGEDADQVLLVGHVGGDALHLEAVGAQVLGGGLELVRPPRGDRQRVARPRRAPGRSPARSRSIPGDQCRSLRQLVLLRCSTLRADPICAHGARIALGLGIAVNNMPPMRLTPSPRRPRLPARGRDCAGRLWRRSDSSTGSSSSQRRRAARAAEERFPQRRGQDPRRGARSRRCRRPTELVVVARRDWSSTRARTAYPFGVFERDRTQIPDADVALYLAKVPGTARRRAGDESERQRRNPEREGSRRSARTSPRSGRSRPRSKRLQTQPAFRAQTTTSDPDAATVVYSTDVDFPSNGEWRIAALIKEDDELTATLLPSARSAPTRRCRRSARRRPLIHTPTPADVGGDLSKITTRIPPDTQNKVDYADVIGKEPIVLLFATPQFCQSRVCGPVVDVAEQVKQLYGDKAAFIHMEIYNDNDPNKGVRPAGPRLPPAERALAVRDRPRWDDRRP